MEEHLYENIHLNFDYLLPSAEDRLELIHDYLIALRPSCEELEEWAQSELSYSLGG